MNLKGEKVLLRALERDDMKLLNKLINDEEIEMNVVGWNKPISMEEQNNWFDNLKNDPNFRYTICDLDNIRNAIGTAIISKIDWKNRSASIDIKINSENSNKGYGTDTVKIIIKYIFEEMNFNRIFVNILDYNKYSQKLFTKCGFKQEGIQKQAIYKDGSYHSLVMYALLRDEYLYET